MRPIHPLPRGADLGAYSCAFFAVDSSPPTRGRPLVVGYSFLQGRFIPSHEGQTDKSRIRLILHAIHPLPRGADALGDYDIAPDYDSSPPTRGGHSVFMRLSADLNTSLCNLHKCHSCLIRIFNMPKIPPHFHFFSNYFFVFQPPSLETFRLRMI